MRKTYRKAVFVVVYSKNKYLLLKRKKHWVGWEFTKGGIEKGEPAIKTAKREVREETGLKIKKIRKYNVSGKYRYSKELKDRPNRIGQTYRLFSAEVIQSKVKIDRKEHSGHKWFEFKEALKKLTWPNQKKCLKIVESKK